MKNFLTFNAIFLLAIAVDLHAESPSGVSVSYQLPTAGVLPITYCVTLAIVDAKNPDWIISQFACGTARTVTAENFGRFEL